MNKVYVFIKMMNRNQEGEVIEEVVPEAEEAVVDEVTELKELKKKQLEKFSKNDKIFNLNIIYNLY